MTLRIGFAQPEVEFGFPKVCYCGGQPIVSTCYTRNDHGRRFYTCRNVDDGEMHIHKWWDVAVMEELTALSDTDAYFDKVVDDLSLINTRFIFVSKLVAGIISVAAVVIALLIRFK